MGIELFPTSPLTLSKYTLQMSSLLCIKSHFLSLYGETRDWGHANLNQTSSARLVIIVNLFELFNVFAPIDNMFLPYLNYIKSFIF